MHTPLCNIFLLCPLLCGMHKPKAVGSLRGRTEKSHRTHRVLKSGKDNSCFFNWF